MKKILLSTITILLAVATIQAQPRQQGGNRRFSPEEFQAKQREFITKEAKLTAEEADAFFPLYFELQKSKHRINHKARKDFRKQPCEQLTDEECKQMINSFAEIKIKTALLEKEYIEKYLKILPPIKIINIQRAEEMFQREILKKMSRRQNMKR